MNRKLRPTRSAQQRKDKQIGLVLEEIEQDIEGLKKTISEKNKQLHDFKKILKAAKNSYQEATKENKQLKQYITTIEQQQQQQQQYKQQQQKQQAYFSKPKKYKKVVYEEASDSDAKENQQEPPIF